MELLEKHFDIAFAAPDGIKKLRELILTMAMQGKLVPQDPNDQSASELLKEIEAEKRRLVKEGKIKQPKPMPEVVPEEMPYELPTEWKWVRLGASMLKITDGTHHSPVNTEVGDFLYISAKNIKNDGVLLVNSTYVTKAIHEEIYSRCDPEYGDILYIKDGATTGVVTINNIREPFSMLSSVALLKPPKHIFNKFLFLSMKSPLFYSEMRAEMTGVAITRVTLQKLQNAIIPLPPLAEQYRIVTKIDQLMARCDELEKLRSEREQKRLTVHTAALNRLLMAPESNDFNTAWRFITQHFGELYSDKASVAELRKAVLQLAIMGKLVPQDPHDQPARELLKEIEAEKKRLVKEGKIKAPKPLAEIKPEEVPYQLPDGWEWIRLGEIGETQTGTTPPKNDDDNFGDHIPFIGPGDIKKHVIDYSGEGLSKAGLSKGRLIEKNSVLMVCIGGSIGKHAINDRDITCNQQINTVTPYKRDSVKYLFYAIGTQYFQSVVVGQAGGSATPIINKQKWSSIPIPLPPAAEQRRIDTKIEKLMFMCDSLEQHLNAVEYKRATLLNAVMAQV